MGAGSKITLKDFNSGDLARVVDGRLLVSSTGGGGGGGAVDITAVGGVAIGATVPVSGTVSVTEPVSVDDNGGSLTVDGSVSVSNFPATQPISGTVSVTEPVSVDDNGGSLTVDGSVAVTNFPAVQPVSGTVSVTEPVSVDDNGGSLTVDGSVSVSNFPATQPVSGTVEVEQATHADLNATVRVQDGDGATLMDVVVPGVSATENEATGVVPLLYCFDTTSGTPAPPRNAYSNAYINEIGEVLVHVGGEVNVKTLPASTVEVSGNVTIGPMVTPGTGATNLGKEEDAAHASGDVGVMALAVRQDTLAVLAGATGDYIPLSTDRLNRLDVIKRGGKQTYRAATPTFLQVGAATQDMFFVISGSGTRTIIVQRVKATGMTTVGGQYGEIVVEKWSSAPTGGTPVALVQVPLDSANNAPTANLCQVYTAAPTEGTLLGTIGVKRDQFMPIAVGISTPLMMEAAWDFRNEGENHGVVLRGTAECLSLACGTLPFSAFLVSVEVEWTEE